MHRKKIPTYKPQSMTCECGVDATDGYNVVTVPQFSHERPKTVRRCVECYERGVRCSIYRGKAKSSITRGYYV